MLETLDVDFGVRMAHVTNDRASFQLLALLSSDDAFVSRRRYDYIHVFDDFVESDNFEAIHAIKILYITVLDFYYWDLLLKWRNFLPGLKGANRIDFGDIDHTSDGL